MFHLSLKLFLTAIVICLVKSEYDSLRTILRQKVIPLEDMYPQCEPNTICKWAVCPWTRNPEQILSSTNCFFYNNHQCSRCPENYECQNTNEKEVESEFVTFAYRCLPM